MARTMTDPPRVSRLSTPGGISAFPKDQTGKVLSHRSSTWSTTVFGKEFLAGRSVAMDEGTEEGWRVVFVEGGPRWGGTGAEGCRARIEVDRAARLQGVEAEVGVVGTVVDGARM